MVSLPFPPVVFVFWVDGIRVPFLGPSLVVYVVILGRDFALRFPLFFKAEVEEEIAKQPAGWLHEADGKVDPETNRARIKEDVDASNKEDSVRNSQERTRRLV